MKKVKNEVTDGGKKMNNIFRLKKEKKNVNVKNNL